MIRRSHEESFSCAILASSSYPAIASSLQDQLSAVAEAEQQGKMKSKRHAWYSQDKWNVILMAVDADHQHDRPEQ